MLLADSQSLYAGQGEMWGETVDASDVESTVWPKLAAIAERLWSPRAATAARDEVDTSTALNTPHACATFLHTCL